ncbi:14438_t:CDS:1, partial [Funneliformis geosporum]
KAVAAFTIQNFYLRRTTLRKKTIETIRYWIDKEKENVNHEDDEIIDGSDNIINNSGSNGDNEIYNLHQSDQRIGYTHKW